MEGIQNNDENFKEDLTISRLCIGITYLNSNFIELLIKQLTQVSSSFLKRK